MLFIGPFYDPDTPRDAVRWRYTHAAAMQAILPLHLYFICTHKYEKHFFA
jgi:hypothetical protein